MESFRVDWSARDLNMLRNRIRDWQVPPNFGGSGWRFGCDREYLISLRDYWADRYDFQAAQTDLNLYPQFVAEVEPGIRIHFVHIRGESEGRRPLLMIHGWPSSHYGFWRLIPQLAFPSRHGGAAHEAFDLIIPSLPGYAFSSKPTPPVGARTTAVWLDRLMRGVLGYDRYFAYGTDWGAAIAPWLALTHREVMLGIYLDHFAVDPAVEPETEAEQTWARNMQAHQGKLGAYYQLHTTKPQSLAYAAANNPVGQAAWIIERYHDWADLREGSLDEVFGRDFLLTNIMLYVMTGSFESSVWFYAASELENAKRIPPGRRIEVPTGFATYPDPRQPIPPRSLVQKGYELAYWVDQDRGGHFAATEVPGLVAASLRTWASIATRGC
jgi:pimeloyl-ACP methyl ester carboxylesterase